MSRYYFTLFALSTVIAWGPSKLVPYLAPAIVTVVLALLYRSAFKRLIILLGCFVLWTSFVALMTIISGKKFVVQNVFLALVTYSSFYPLLILPNKYLNERIYVRMARLAFVVLLVEATIGYIQVLFEFARRHTFDLNVGDVVEGTIDLAFRSAVGFETKIFAMNVGLTLLLILPYLWRKRRTWSVLWVAYFGGVFLAAAVMHLIFSLGLALLSAGFVTAWQAGMIRNFKRIFYLLTVLLLTGLILLKAMPTNITLAPKMVEFLSINPKVRLVTALVHNFPYQTIVGFGPGQGVSRAALIATNEFLRVKIDALPLVEPHKTSVIQKLGVIEMLRSPLSRNSILRPTSSWIASVSEFGILGFFVLLGVVVRLLLRRYVLGWSWETILFRSAVLFVFFGGLFELYWEVPQAIFPGLLLLKAFQASLDQHGKRNIG